MRELLALACVAMAASATVPSDNSTPSIVSREGARFTLDGAPFFVMGANQYDLLTYASYGPDQRAQVTGLLDNARALGLNVIRTWAFCDGKRSGALQPAAGKFDEHVFTGFDWVIAEAAKRDIRLILTLTNYWDDFGGIQQYVQWARDDGDYAYSKEAFFSSTTCKRLYLQFAEALINRNNTFTGAAYRDDGTILAWELINEARLPQDKSGDTLQAWIEETSSAIKALDPNHMVTIGLEGFFGPSAPQFESHNPYSGASAGTDFLRNHDVDSIDFTTIHAYPDQWLQCSFACGLDFISQWYSAHLDASSRLGKPLLFEEYGAKRNYGSLDQRDAMFRLVFDSAEKAAADANSASAVGGWLFWILAGSSSVPDYDGYTVYMSDSSTTQLIRVHARALQSIGNGTSAGLLQDANVSWR